jgi:DNA-binding MarR family transcriptional regulator
VTKGDLYRLTAAGSAHWQRSATARRADIPPLPFRSGRVFAVLSFLATRGPTRTRDVGHALGISQTSMNALMQTLKRKKMVRTQSDAHHAPYELTQDGRETLAAKQAETHEQFDAAA